MPRNNVLVDAEWVEAHLDDPKVVLVEVDEDTAAYEKKEKTWDQVANSNERWKERIDLSPLAPPVV